MSFQNFTNWQKVLMIASGAVLVWSGINPHDRLTWLLESSPGILGLILLTWFHWKYRITSVLFILVCVHAVILFVGGKYTYAEVPAGFWVSELMGWSRNNYDKLGHFIQGFEPAILTREILRRQNVLPEGRWLGFLTVSVCLAFSAFYELIEWWVAELSGESSEAFLGTQGYVWDTQSDMALAALGAVLAIVLLSRLHRRQLKSI